MFNPKELLEMLVRGGQSDRPRQSAEPSGYNDISDLLRQFGQDGGNSEREPARQSRSETRQEAPSTGGGGLDDLLAELQRRAGGVGETAGDVFGQARDGVREGAGKIGSATGLDDIIGQLSGGRSPQELIEQVQKYMRDNQLGTGAVLGGLGALILGTQTGRSIATGAVKLGALALIGGLAYKAYQNYSEGRPLITDRSEAPEAAPNGSGFDEASVSDEATLSYIRAMIAAAAADGRLDADEQQRIVGSLKDQGLDTGAEEFLANELNNPASVESLAQGSRSREEDIQLYTAARIAIDPDTNAEQRFLAVLGRKLGLEEDLMQHINATARNAA
ncbi:MAG: tellurite resistance TerB family protein, partial [Hyphomicrobiaceae bacterium]